MPSETVLQHARTLWDYHLIAGEIPESVDFVLALGCCDERVAERAAELVLDGRSDRLVLSGGYGKISATVKREPEARRFQRIARERGVPDSRILLEERASNTGQNILYTRDLLEAEQAVPDTENFRDPASANRVPVSSGLLVCKPYMERRSVATADCQWSELTWSVTSPKVPFERYAPTDALLRQMIELMVGDLQRIKLYAECDPPFQTVQTIPDDVWGAYHALVQVGYARYLINARLDANASGRTRDRETVRRALGVSRCACW